jgi:hypothetical protein
MKFAFLILVFFLSIISFAGPHQVLNPILKNKSLAFFQNYFPGIDLSEQTKVACHLLYAEALLRQVSTTHLNPTQKKNRIEQLDNLHFYALRGEFPVNAKYENKRAPCFIDAGGTLCAVGYLVEQSEGLAYAQLINSEFQYADIFEMDEALLLEWAAENGFTLIELAMIQPTYEWRNSYSKNTSLLAIGSYRPQGELFLGASLMRYQKRWGSKLCTLTGYGANFEWLTNGSFATGIRGLAGFGKNQFAQPVSAVNLEYAFAKNGRSSLNLTPEIGLQSQLNLRGNMMLTLILSYGYHFGILNSSFYTPERHDISLGIGIGWNGKLFNHDHSNNL